MKPFVNGNIRFLWLGSMDYPKAMELQDRMVEERIKGLSDDTVLFLEHPHTVTKGRRACEVEVEGLRKRGIPFYEVSRGGLLTYHGPGQLLAYPIIKLSRYGMGIRQYVRLLERVIIETLSVFGLKGEGREGLVGVWIGQKKVASIGIGVRRGVTYHGLALNVKPDLRFFKLIRPCGLDGGVMTSMEKEGVVVDVTKVIEVMEGAFLKAFSRPHP